MIKKVKVMKIINKVTGTTNNYKLTQEQLDNALAYMVSEGYMDPSNNTDDLLSFTFIKLGKRFPIPFMVTAKIKEWSNAYVQSKL